MKYIYGKINSKPADERLYVNVSIHPTTKTSKTLQTESEINCNLQTIKKIKRKKKL